MAYEVKVTRQGQSTIPKPLREKYSIEEGDRIIYIDMGDHITILPVPDSPLDVLEKIAVRSEQPTGEIRKESLLAAQKLAEERLNRG